MSPEMINITKVAAVVVIYWFLWLVVRGVRAHLAPARPAPGGQATLSIITAAGRRELAVASPTVLGRGTEVDYLLDDPYSSERHVRLDRVEGRLVIEDLGSTNGTFVNGIRIEGRRALERGDEIRVGQTIMEIA